MADNFGAVFQVDTVHKGKQIAGIVVAVVFQSFLKAGSGFFIIGLGLRTLQKHGQRGGQNAGNFVLGSTGLFAQTGNAVRT